jgi:type VI secretion system protein ImpA
VVAAPTAFASRAEVDAALAAALGYFAAAEPTSPSLLLIRQAREMLGKNLYEVMQLLAAQHADNARVSVGPDGAFSVPVKILAGAPSSPFERAQPEPATSRAAALALIDAVAQHMQRAEPSSPVPYLLERAKNLATRDFVNLLHDVLSDEAIAALKKGK